MPKKTFIHGAMLLLAACTISGCYYTQAARGQLEVLQKREPIEDVLADPDTPEEVATRLKLVQDARRYSIDVLGLPDNDSYQTYADLERDYVVWSVYAADEFSLDPKRWCYPIVGCVSYRGYFKKDAAGREAQKLRNAGFDVFVGGVAAYSTLGKFDDPVLNTMMRWDDVQLVGVLFHELAHQLLYIKHDTGFNESFATAVEESGVERFLADRGMQDAFAAYSKRKDFRRTVMTLINDTRDDLQTYYAETIDPDEKRLLKEHRIEQLTEELRLALVQSGRDPESWLWAPFNNARLVSFSLYEGLLPAFRQMLADCADDLPCFYAEARRVSQMEEEARAGYLETLVSR